VARDPSNRCEYFPCKVNVMECNAELFRCSNGRYVGRNPENNCEYFSCEVGGDTAEMSEQSSSMSIAAMTQEHFTSNLNQSLRHKKGRQEGR
jgi:Zn-finger protein